MNRWYEAIRTAVVLLILALAAGGICTATDAASTDVPWQKVHDALKAETDALQYKLAGNNAMRMKGVIAYGAGAVLSSPMWFSASSTEGESWALGKAMGIGALGIGVGAGCQAVSRIRDFRKMKAESRRMNEHLTQWEMQGVSSPPSADLRKSIAETAGRIGGLAHREVRRSQFENNLVGPGLVSFVGAWTYSDAIGSSDDMPSGIRAMVMAPCAYVFFVTARSMRQANKYIAQDLSTPLTKVAGGDLTAILSADESAGLTPAETGSLPHNMSLGMAPSFAGSRSMGLMGTCHLQSGSSYLRVGIGLDGRQGALNYCTSF